MLMRHAINYSPKIWKNWLNRNRKKDPGGRRKTFAHDLVKFRDITASDPIATIRNSRFTSAEKKEEEINSYKNQQGR